MRVIQLLPELNEGGVERGVIELNREFVKRRVESIVISRGGKLASQVILDGGTHIEFDICSKNIFSSPYRIYKLKKLFLELKPDILHIRSRVPAWLTLFANMSLKIPTVSTIHGFNSVNLYSKVMTKFDRLIAVSSQVKEYIEYNYEVDSSKISVIHRGVDFEIFDKNRADIEFIEEIKAKYSLNGHFLVSAVGRITQLKSIETLIEAINILKPKFPIKALIVGGVRSDKKEYFEFLQKLIKKKQLQNDIIFTGSLSKVVEIYSMSDIVVSCSKKPESFGRSLSEALSLNTPVIATNHGGVKDIIQNGVNGYLFEPQNAIELAEAIIKSKTLKRDFRDDIKARFSLDKMVEDNLKLYKELIN
jgi:glycosyltransferase involved in cell wall biosynthesis